jgi:hypothetical protein
LPRFCEGIATKQFNCVRFLEQRKLNWESWIDVIRFCTLSSFRAKTRDYRIPWNYLGSWYRWRNTGFINTFGKSEWFVMAGSGIFKKSRAGRMEC